MTDKPDTAKLRELLKAATPGPWASAKRRGSWDWVVVVPGTPNEICQMFHDGTEWNETGEANTHLIVAAVNALPALLDTLELVKGLVEKWRKNEDNAYRQIVYETCADELQSTLSGCTGAKQE